MKESKITVFYRPEMCPPALGEMSESRSPLKPKLLLEFIEKQHLSPYFELRDAFAPFTNEEFYIAHTENYVEGFFKGEAPHSNGHGLLGIEWSREYAESTRYTNASLYHAILESINRPSKVCLSPTSGFHHAIPEYGALFCPFSGQVIAAMKLYRESGISGAFIDLDGHFGNSIEDSRAFVKDLDKAIPKGCNINIKTKHGEYLEDLKIRLLILQELFLENKIHYLVFCHGADSHEEDDIGHQLTTVEWLACAELFADCVKRIEALSGRLVPVSLALFGGYRQDDYDCVLSLHAASLMKILNELSEVEQEYPPVVNINERKKMKGK
jgi:acetoin utilization deacetylase AcuC-like enzyme